ncbi:hypothetical protein GCM10010116_06690 [Microbispora rosea subsp. aerata]|nr:hypothetical protein GCM10010116_06690 [Microbispora rosea subsp. aerata]
MAGSAGAVVSSGIVTADLLMGGVGGANRHSGSDMRQVSGVEPWENPFTPGWVRRVEKECGPTATCPASHLRAKPEVIPR